ncbi:MAG TPA: RDD family protein [Blastocatellia bacterium]|nr:RDD family protein [Blastocatellia bacterium]
MSQAIKRKFCPYCGKELRERSRFCPQCGKATPHRQTGGIGQAPAEVATRAYEQPPELRLQGGASPAQTRPMEADQNARPRPVVVKATRDLPALADARRRARPARSPVSALERAEFGLRYGAWMFDFLITLIAIMVFTFVMTAVSNRSVVGSNWDLVIIAGLALLLFVLNFVVFAGWGGQSAGMRILGIRIVRVDGKPFTGRDAVIRHLLGYPLSMAVFFLGFLWMLWDSRQQAWHDKLAGTIVVMSR